MPAVNQKAHKKERKESTSKKSKKAASIPVIDLEAKDVDVMETEDYDDYDEDCAARPCKQPTGKKSFNLRFYLTHSPQRRYVSWLNLL